MVQINALAEIGALVGDPGRANMLAALLDGRALTAGELAGCAGVAPQTASGHLAKLAAAGLIRMERQGRHHYHRLASADVAQMLERMMQVAEVAAPPARPPRTGPRDAALRAARSCYDHLAGRLAVDIAQALTANDGADLTDLGRARLAAFGVDLAAAGRGARPLCRPCLDWSERRPHLAGAVGKAILDRSLDLQWVRRHADSRALTITPAGREGFRTMFGVG